LPLDFVVNTARLYLGVRMLDSYSLVESGGALASATITIAANYNSKPTINGLTGWDPTAELGSELDLGSLAVLSETALSLRSGTLTEEVGGKFPVAVNAIAVTPAVSLVATLNTPRIDWMRTSITIEGYRTVGLRAQAENAARNKLACCSILPEDNGKLSLELAVEGPGLDDLGFSARLSHVQWLCRARLAAQAYVVLGSDTLSLSSARCTLGVALAW